METKNYGPPLINKILNYLTYIAGGIFFIWIWSKRELKIAIGYLIICGVTIWILALLAEKLIKFIDQKKRLNEWHLNFGLPSHWLVILLMAGIIQLVLIILIAFFLLH